MLTSIKRFFNKSNAGAKTTAEDASTHDIRVAAYEHNGQTAIPNADTVLHNGDILMAAIDVTQLATFSRFMKN